MRDLEDEPSRIPFAELKRMRALERGEITLAPMRPAAEYDSLAAYHEAKRARFKEPPPADAVVGYASIKRRP